MGFIFSCLSLCLDGHDSCCHNTVGPPERNILVDQQFEFKELVPIFGNFTRFM